ncbi:MAG: DUF1329 domain-containing protein [Candidatus Binataceae bacterium]
MMRRNVLLVVVLAAALILPTVPAAAQDLDTFNEKLIDEFVPANSPETIPAGTRITTANWQQYRKFMPISLQAFMSGKYFWKMGSGPEDYIEVGPTIPTQLPTKYLADTEKYSGQAQLVKLPNGSYNVKNYSAGIPFPNPTDPDIGGKLLYDLYYTYIPSMYWSSYPVAFVDRFFNATGSIGIQLFFKLSHVSDTGEPITNPQANGIYISIYDQQITPEQSKYLTSMAIFPDDPNRVPELYVFLPSLRRSLRLSSTARCSPLQGTDWTNDDQRGGFSGIPNWFIPHFLGEKKMLFVAHSGWTGNAKESDNYLANWVYGGHASGFIKPQRSKFELRDVYVLDLVPNTDTKSFYCYSHRVLYLDRQLAYTADHVDTWDRNDKLWKLQFVFRGPTTAIPSDLNGQKSFVLPSGGENAVIYDVQADHASVAWPASPPTLNSAVPEQYHNLSLYALPSGLTQIMK